MRRREFIGTLSGAAAWPLTARAQQTGKRPTVALLSTDPNNPLLLSAFPAFLAELRKLGFTEGVNLTVESPRIEKDSSKTLRVDHQRAHADREPARKSPAEMQHAADRRFEWTAQGFEVGTIVHGNLHATTRCKGEGLKDWRKATLAIGLEPF